MNNNKDFYFPLYVVVCQMVASMVNYLLYRDSLYQIDLKDAQFVYIE